MNRLQSMTLLALSGVALATIARSAGRNRATRPVAAAPVPDRAVVEQPHVHHEELETYQALLDESLHLTFPASDPISAHAATRCGDALETPTNPSDWHLHPGSATRPGVDPLR